MSQSRVRVGSLSVGSWSGLKSACLAFCLFAQPWAAHARPDEDATRSSIVRATVSLLESAAFSPYLRDERLGQALIAHYCDVLDPSRVLLLQTDVQPLVSDAAAVGRAIRGDGDVTLAHDLFGRYLERLGQQVAYDESLLATAAFAFGGHDAALRDRSHATRPRDLTTAHLLWRQELRAVYLDEKVNNPTWTASQIAETLTRRLDRHLGDMRALSDDDVLAFYLETLARIYDPRADYLGHLDAESFTDLVTLSVVGVGASLTKLDGVCVIGEVAPDSPAERAGLRPGVRVLAAGDDARTLVDLREVPLRKAR